MVISFFFQGFQSSWRQYKFLSEGQIFNVVNTYNYGKIFEQSSTYFCYYENLRETHAPSVLCSFEHLASCFDL